MLSRRNALRRSGSRSRGITIVAWNLPNGFTISDQSGCVDPKNYDREIGVGICREHLRDQLWKLYGFALKEQFGRGDEEVLA